MVAWLAAGNSELKFDDVLAMVSGRAKEALSLEAQMALVDGSAPKGG